MKPVSERTRLKARVRGAVQGVGFRPFIFRLATELGLAGWVNNSPQGVCLEVEGPRAALEQFLLRLEAEKPPRSFIQSLEASWLDPVGCAGFEIRESEAAGEKTALVLPDIATCPDCLREILDPSNRRYRYPFTNCTNCGPRFSIIETLPYDRANTSMKSFAMCPECRVEYEDPRDRRFHAQPNACPVCGPHLELWDSEGVGVFAGQKALLAAARAICRGRIVAVKGLGGFHLMVAARDEAAVRRLRKRKHREEKPFALMCPSLETVRAACQVSPLEERLLRSPEAPIVLLQRITSGSSSIANAIAPGNPSLGVMLPYTPLHYLLLAELGFPVVATSGNLSDEPICINEREALERLCGIADIFLVHDRPIVRPVDDSVARVMLDRELVLRRARGYAPLPIQFPQGGTPSTASQTSKVIRDVVERVPPETILAVGAHLKNSIALAVGNQVFLSQHIGDLETEPAHAAFRRVIADFEKLFDIQPGIVAADLHPDYLSTKFADEFIGTAGNPLPPTVGAQGTTRPTRIGVQHHIAHVLSCMAENELAPPALGVAWDGTGYGSDGAIWGGEFFQVTDNDIDRVAHLRPFRLPGGDKAVKEPRRTALGLLYELSGNAIFAQTDLPSLAVFSATELRTIRTMLERRLNSPLTTSVGRLFDAIASLVGLRQKIRFEGQAAMELEFALEGMRTDEAYPIALITHRQAQVLDWSPLVETVLADVQHRSSVRVISARFHNALAEGIVAVARQVGQSRVVLSGGCFQNRYLTERAVSRLRAEGFRPYWHQRVPPNDGGIALGQVVAALRQMK